MQGSAVWRELQLLLSLNLPESAYYLWEGTATCCACDDQRLVIVSPTEQSARQLVQAYLPVVRRTLQAIPDAPGDGVGIRTAIGNGDFRHRDALCACPIAP